MHKKSEPGCVCNKCPIRNTCQFTIRQAVVELLKVRTLLTLLYSITFCIAFLRGDLESWHVSVPLFIGLLTMILTFYFKKEKGE
jgi:uncharacterized membrane protein